jgi:hypothetical protein
MAVPAWEDERTEARLARVGPVPCRCEVCGQANRALLVRRGGGGELAVRCGCCGAPAVGLDGSARRRWTRLVFAAKLAGLYS